MRPWVVQACYSTAFCFSVSRALCEISNVSTRGWVEHLHPVVASQLPEESNTETSRPVGPSSRYPCQKSLAWPSASNTPTLF